MFPPELYLTGKFCQLIVPDLILNETLCLRRISYLKLLQLVAQGFNLGRKIAATRLDFIPALFLERGLGLHKGGMAWMPSPDFIAQPGQFRLHGR